MWYMWVNVLLGVISVWFGINEFFMLVVKKD